MEFFTGNAVAHADIAVDGGFWKEKQELFRNVTIDAIYNRFKETGRMDALKQEWKEGDPQQPHIFWESDVTKWIEGAACFLAHQRDPELEAKIDELVEYMQKTQQKDGYLNTYFTVVEPEARFTRRTDHELYCAGHLVEGAIAYAEATGKTAMLEVATRYIDLIDKTFRIEHSAKFDTPGHQEIELALMRLHRYTGEERYKLLAEYFINTRGTSDRDETYSFTDQAHMQSHLPVREQLTAEGHSVRALYMYCGMADLANANHDKELYDVCKTLFQNIVEKRMYITGGVGSTHLGESFTFDYHLPEYTAYAETCASIALAMFCRRMWLIEPDSIYADCAERALYNTVLGGVSCSGDSFFYENPLAADPKRNSFNRSRPKPLQEHLPILERVKVFDCSCCPPNLLRMVGEIAEFQYSTSQNTVFAHCYMGSTARLSLENGFAEIKQETRYPYDGAVRITVENSANFILALRIPEWARNRASIAVNGDPCKNTPVKGYVYIDRAWQKGDTVEIDFVMDVRVIEANPLVADLCGRAAVMRGPLVFCAEGVDNPHGVRDIRIPRQGWEVANETVCGCEIPALCATAKVRKPVSELYFDNPAETETFALKLIPYHAWANRGVTEMATWLLLDSIGN